MKYLFGSHFELNKAGDDSEMVGKMCDFSNRRAEIRGDDVFQNVVRVFSFYNKLEEH